MKTSSFLNFFRLILTLDECAFEQNVRMLQSNSASGNESTAGGMISGGSSSGGIHVGRRVDEPRLGVQGSVGRRRSRSSARKPLRRQLGINSQTDTSIMGSVSETARAASSLPRT